MDFTSRTGALIGRPDPRDYIHTDEMALGVAPVDWVTGFMLPETKQFDQGSSDSCVSHAWTHLHNFYKGKEFSRRDLFSRIAQNDGAYIVDGCKELVKRGQLDNKEAPDPTHPDRNNMRDRSGIDEKLGYDDIEAEYWTVASKNMDTIAQAVRDFNGAVFGIIGSNEGFTNPSHPRPPISGESTWGHCLSIWGYKLINGKKAFICKSSWNEVPYHYIDEDYFVDNGAFIFNCWFLKPKMSQFKTQNYKGELRIVLQASTPEQWAALKAVYGITNDTIDEVIT